MIWLWRKDSNLRMAALTVRCLTNLATPQERLVAGTGVSKIANCRLSIWVAYSIEFFLSQKPNWKLAIGNRQCLSCGDETRTRTLSFTRRALCYPIELRRNLMDWERFKIPQEVAGLLCCRLHAVYGTGRVKNYVLEFSGASCLLIEILLERYRSIGVVLLSSNLIELAPGFKSTLTFHIR